MGNNPVNRIDPDGGTDCTGNCDYDPNKDPAYHPEFGVTVNSTRFNAFESWIYDAYNNLKSGKWHGISYYSDIGYGPIIDLRNGTPDYSIANPAFGLGDFSKVSWLKTFPKGHIPNKNVATELKEIFENSKDVFDAINKANGASGAIKNFRESMHSKIHGFKQGTLEGDTVEVNGNPPAGTIFPGNNGRSYKGIGNWKAILLRQDTTIKK
jgi:hypothetical protein